MIACIYVTFLIHNVNRITNAHQYGLLPTASMVIPVMKVLKNVRSFHVKCVLFCTV
jgi:hypothetical protein